VNELSAVGQCTVLKYLPSKKYRDLETRVRFHSCHWKWRHSIGCIWLPNVQ